MRRTCCNDMIMLLITAVHYFMTGLDFGFIKMNTKFSYMCKNMGNIRSLVVRSDLYILDSSQIVIPSDTLFITIYSCARVVGSYCYYYGLLSFLYVCFDLLNLWVLRMIQSSLLVNIL